MPIHLQKEIQKLKKLLLSVCAMVEDDVWQAVRAVTDRNEALAQKVIDMDREIDQAEVDVEEEALKILALHQPVAIDLRYIIAAIKINNDLERIGDLAVNIAERAVFLSKQAPPAIPFDLVGMAQKTQTMLHKSLDAMVNSDTTLARDVMLLDDDVDAINRNMYEQVQSEIRKHPEQAESLIHMLSISRFLERIADHATNISEDVIYLVEGGIVRHKRKDQK